MSEIKETSIEEKSIFSPKSSGVTYRIFVFSIQTTRSSCLNFQASCPFPTSIANTFLAPFCNIQSVNPPVEDPTSVHTLSCKSTSKFATAFSNFKPPRLTYGSTCPFISICTSSENVVPALSSLCPSTKTFPDIIIAFAFSRDSTRFLFTNNTSKRSFMLSPIDSSFQIQQLSYPQLNLHPTKFLFEVNQCFPVPRTCPESH